MDTHDIIAIGGSTGALDVLMQVFRDLPADLPASVFVVRHIAESGSDTLASMLDGVGPLTVRVAGDGDPFERGRGYVAAAGEAFAGGSWGDAAGAWAAGEHVAAGGGCAVPVGSTALRAAGDRDGADRVAG